MTYKEQEKLITLEMTREEWDRVGEVLGYAIREAMENHDYTTADKILKLSNEMNATSPSYRWLTEQGT